MFSVVPVEPKLAATLGAWTAKQTPKTTMDWNIYLRRSIKTEKKNQWHGLSSSVLNLKANPRDKGLYKPVLLFIGRYRSFICKVKNGGQNNTESRPNFIYTSHFSRVQYNSSSRKLVEIAINQCNAHRNSKVEHVASMVYCNVVESATYILWRVRLGFFLSRTLYWKKRWR